MVRKIREYLIASTESRCAAIERSSGITNPEKDGDRVDARQSRKIVGSRGVQVPVRRPLLISWWCLWKTIHVSARDQWKAFFLVNRFVDRAGCDHQMSLHRSEYALSGLDIVDWIGIPGWQSSSGFLDIVYVQKCK